MTTMVCFFFFFICNLFFNSFLSSLYPPLPSLACKCRPGVGFPTRSCYSLLRPPLVANVSRCRLFLSNNDEPHRCPVGACHPQGHQVHRNGSFVWEDCNPGWLLVHK